MKKSYLLFFLFFVATLNIAVAQQKPVVKKPTTSKAKKTKVYITPPVKIAEAVTVTPPPPSSIKSAPSIMADPSTSRFNSNSICTDCDTLKLESNKPSIVIYDVKWMANTDSRTYKDQPTEKDLAKSYFALSGIKKREWDELRINFPEGDFIYHYVYRNTLIATPNKKRQTLSLLDRQDRHEGFLYWSGKENDSTLNKKTMAKLTEAVANARGEKKISSYYNKFAKDSTTIEQLQATRNPSARLVANMNIFLQKEIFNETILPLQFFNMDKVSKITIQSVKEQNKVVALKFNTKGQITQLNERNDSTTFTYKDNLPLQAINRYNKPIKYYYQGDTVIVRENNYLKVNKLVDKMLIGIKIYSLEKDKYDEMTLDKGFEIKLSKNATFCINEFADEIDYAAKTCYSNTNWQLPLTVTASNSRGSHSDKSETFYKINEEKNLVIEDVNDVRQNKREYIITDGKPKSIKSFKKRDGEQYGEPYVLNITYEYFK